MKKFLMPAVAALIAAGSTAAALANAPANPPAKPETEHCADKRDHHATHAGEDHGCEHHEGTKGAH